MTKMHKQKLKKSKGQNQRYFPTQYINNNYQNFNLAELAQSLHLCSEQADGQQHHAMYPWQ